MTAGDVLLVGLVAGIVSFLVCGGGSALWGYAFHLRRGRSGKWAVVQELLPFGYTIHSRRWFRWSANAGASWSQYLTVMPYDEVVAENRRLADGRQFDAELRRYTARRKVA